MDFSYADFIAGWGSGVCGLVVGQPMDTIKVIQQTSGSSSVVQTFMKTFRSEGIRGLYKGMLFPLLFAGIQNSFFFGVFATTVRELQFKQNTDPLRRTCGEGGEANRFWHFNVFFAGAMAGAMGTILACPVELFKTQLQVRKSGDVSGGLWTLIKELHKLRGPRGFYTGILPTIMRDIPSFGIYVLAYEHFLSMLRSKEDRGYVYHTWQQFIAGGSAGVTSWVICNPLDVLKSRIQGDSFTEPKYAGLKDCLMKTYHEGGWRSFTRGTSVHFIRGFPVNAATLSGYEIFLDMYDSFDNIMDSFVR